MPTAKKKTKKKATARKKKAAAAPSPLREIVGQDVYDTWVTMLKELVPSGRTQRLSVLVASMLAYASSVAEYTDDQDDPAYPFLLASEGMDDEETSRLLGPMLTQLFRDAKVKYERTSSRGQQYSILWEAVIEFNRWDCYPWEG